MIPVGALVTLLVNKTHPDLEPINAGISGMVVQHNPERDGSVRHVVDFGPEGQWNCIEAELRQESMFDRNEPEEPEDDFDEDEEEDNDHRREDLPNAVGAAVRLRSIDDLVIAEPQGEPGIPPLSSFEEDLARMEASKKARLK